MAEEIGIKKDAEMPTTLDWSAKYSLYYPDEKKLPFPKPSFRQSKAESTTNVELIIENSKQKIKNEF
jgi:hypothetical protein